MLGEVYAARTNTGLVCLVMANEMEILATSCITESAFPATGLQGGVEIGPTLYEFHWAASPPRLGESAHKIQPSTESLSSNDSVVTAWYGGNTKFVTRAEETRDVRTRTLQLIPIR